MKEQVTRAVPRPKASPIVPVPTSMWLGSPINDGRLTIPPGGTLSISPKSRERALIGLAEDFRCAGRLTPRLWHILVQRDANRASPESFAPLYNERVEHARGEWPVLTRWAQHDQGLVGMFFGDDPDGTGFRRFEQLARSAAQLVRAVLALPGPRDPVSYWIVHLYRLAGGGDSQISAPCRRRCAIEGAGCTMTLTVKGWEKPAALAPVMSILASWPTERMTGSYAILDPDLWSASALGVEELISHGGEETDAALDAAWRESRWFLRATRGILNSDTLRKARDRGRVKGRKDGSFWEYQVASVVTVYRQHDEEIRRALRTE